MNKICNLSIYSNKIALHYLEEYYMARGQRKSIDEKIKQKQELIDGIKTRLEHERKELEELLNEQKQKEVEILYEFIKTSNLSVYEATEALQQYVSGQYEATA